MATRQGEIRLGIGFDVHKEDFKEIQAELQKLQAIPAKKLKLFGSTKEAQTELSGVKNQLDKIEEAYKKAFNPKLGTVNVAKFNKEIGNTKHLYETLAKFDAQGLNVFNKMTADTLKLNTATRETHKILEGIGTSLKNTIKWSISSSVINSINSSLQKSYYFVKDLDKSLNDIRIVTDKSADDMDRFAISANKAAKALAASTRDYTEASLIYYQQGLSDEEVAARTETTLKTANVTGQRSSEVSEQLTAVWNGYKVNAEEAELYIDKIAAVAASTASDLQELSVGMSKVASAASTMGVDIDKLNGMLSTVISVTRQAPESAGTAFKTIFARMEDLKLGKKDNEGVALGDVSSDLKKMGVDIIDAQGNLRDLGGVIEEVGNKWNQGQWNDQEKQALAISLAGKRQYNNLLALFDNWDMYNKSVETSQNAIGTLQHQQDIYMDSTQAHLQKMRTSWESVYNSFFDTDSINTFADGISVVADRFADLVEVIGGGKGALLSLGSLFTKIFSQQISSEIMTTKKNLMNLLHAEEYRKLEENNFEQMQRQFQEEHSYIKDADFKKSREGFKKVFDGYGNSFGRMTTEEKESYNKHIDDIYKAESDILIWNDKKSKTNNFIQNEFKNNKFSKDIFKEGSELGTTLGKVQEDIKTRLNDSNNALKEIEKDIEVKNDGDIKKYSLIETKGSYKAYIKKINDLTSNNEELFGEHFKEIETKKNQLKAAFNSAPKGNLTPEAKAELQKFQQELDDILIKIIRDKKQSLKEAQGVITQEGPQKTDGKTQTELYNEAKENAVNSAEKEAALVSQRVNIQDITTLVSGIGQLTSSLMMIVNMGKLLTDDTIPATEKFLKILTGMPAAILALVVGLNSVKTSLIGLAGGGVKTASAALINLGGKLPWVTAETLVFDAGIKKLSFSLWQLMWPIALVVAAIGTIVFAVKKANEAYNEHNTKLEEAKEAAFEAADAADKATRAYEELQQTFDKYESGADKLNKLTKGTKEYEEALEEANRDALELIKNNNELAGIATRDANGLITFDEKKKEEILSNSRDKATDAQIISDFAQIGANQKKITADTIELTRKISAIKIQASGKDLKNVGMSIANPQNQPIIKGLSEEQIQNVLKIAAENNGTLALEELERAIGPDFAALILEDKELKNSIEELSITTKNLNDTNQLLLENAIRKKLDVDIDGYKDATESEKSYVAKMLTKDTEADFVQDKVQEKINSLSDKGISDQYAELTGLEATSKAGQFIKDGQEISVSIDSIKDVVSKKMAEDIAIEQNADNYLDDAKKVKKDTDNFIPGLGDAVLDYKATDSLDTSLISPEMVMQIRSMIEAGGEDYKKLNRLFDGQANDLFNDNNYDWEPYIERSQTESEELQGVLNSLSNDPTKALQDEGTIAYLEQLESKYKELSEIQDRGSHKYLQKLRKIKELEEQNAEKALELQQQQNSEKLDNFLNNHKDKNDIFNYEELSESAQEELNKILEDIENTDYKIKLQIDADLQTDVDDAFGLAEEFNNLSDIIKDDLIYTFDEVQELSAAGYGAMFENAQAAADGSIQANRDVVQNFIEGKKAELETDKQSKIEQLENEKTLLIAQREALSNKLSALNSALHAESAAEAASYLQKAQDAQKDYEQHTAKLNAQLNNEQDFSNETASMNENLFNQLGGMYDTNEANANNAEKSATDTQKANIDRRIANAQALVSAYNNVASAVKNSEKGVQTAIQGNSGTSGGVTLNSGGSKSVTAKDISYNEISEEQLQNYFEEGANRGEYNNTINQIINQTQSQLDAINGQIGAVDSGIAALQSAGNNLDNKLKNAGKGKGGKGGGGGSKAKDPQHMDQLEEELDVYHDVDIKIKDITKDLDKLADKQDKLFGKDLIDNLNEQLNILEKQKEVYKEKIALAEMEANRMRNLLKDQGVQFADNGTISNYAKIMQEKLNSVNAIIAAYNNMSAEEQEGYKTTVETAKKDYEEFKKLVSEYEKTALDLIPDLEKEVQSALDKEIEIKIKKFTMAIELHLDASQAERDFNAFKKKVIDGIKDDDILGNALAKLKDFDSYYKEGNKGIVSDLTQQINDTLEQLKQIDTSGISSVYGDNKQQAIEDLKKYQEELMSQLENVEDLVQEIKDSYLDMIDEAKDKFDEQVEQYEYINELIEHDVNLIKLLSGEDSFDQLEKYYEKQEENNKKELEFQRQQVNFWKEKMDAEEKDSEAWKKYKENWQDAVQELNSSIEKSIENLIDKHTNTIDKIFSHLNDKLTNGKGLDYMGEEWDLINKNADQYLDTINSMYEIQKLENKYLDSINDTDSAFAQEKLNNLMAEQLDMLRTKEKLTQYDVDRANALYDIALKEIALKEAQQNKSKMRLKRDSQGNYSYQFVEDEDQILKAQQELADAQNALYNLDKNKYKENLDEIYNVYNEFQEKLKALYLDQTLSVEEREEKEKLLVEQYEQAINDLTEQNTEIRQNLKESAFQELSNMYDEDVQHFQDMTTQEQDILMEQLVPQWNSGIQEMANTFIGEGGFLPSCQDAFEALKQSTQSYEQSLNELEKSAGVDFDSIAKGYDKNIELTKELVKNNEELIKQYNTEIDAIKGVIAEMDTLIGKYTKAKEEALAATQAAFEYQKKEQEKARQEAQKKKEEQMKKEEEKKKQEEAKKPAEGSNAKKPEKTGNGTPYSDSDLSWGIAQSIWTFGGDKSGWGNDPTRSGKLTKAFGSDIARMTQKYINDYANSGQLVNKNSKKFTSYELIGYDTGGYTGSWGNEDGRLALLHEKELVLNKEDTKNILSSISIVRDMDSILDKYLNNNMVQRLAELTEIGMTTFKDIVQQNADTIEQNVHIDAVFRDVREAGEIQNALDNLINVASQYANRRTR